MQLSIYFYTSTRLFEVPLLSSSQDSYYGLVCRVLRTGMNGPGGTMVRQKRRRRPKCRMIGANGDIAASTAAIGPWATNLCGISDKGRQADRVVLL